MIKIKERGSNNQQACVEAYIVEKHTCVTRVTEDVKDVQPKSSTVVAAIFVIASYWTENMSN